MNKAIQFKKLGLAVALAGAYSAGLNAASVDGTATATLVAPISVAETTSMNFGTIGAGPTGGNVVLDLANGRSSTGDINLVGGGAAGTGVTGIFTITGESGQAYTLSITGGTLTDAGGLNPMSITGFSNDAIGTLPAATEAFNVGATLAVPGGHPAGSYSTANAGGTAVTVTVNYN